ncbi:MAG: MOSC domain-containing protein [Acidimicrobiales bacterium]
MTNAATPGSPTEPVATAAVSSLFIYPVKSCRRVEVDHATVSSAGIVGDRQWQVAAGKRPRTQRQQTVMATVQPTLIDGGIRLTAPGAGTVEVAKPTGTDHVTGSIVGATVEVGDAGDEAAAWFAKLLDDDDARLYAITDQQVQVPPGWDHFGPSIGFPDLAPVLLTNTASLDWLLERSSEPFDMHRFRPNIVVSGAEPFAEDTWLRFNVGQAELSASLPWARCPMPQIDQDDGTRHREPAKVLKAHRWCTSAPTLNSQFAAITENHAVFGIGSAIQPAGAVISTGDQVVVSDYQAPLIARPA